MSVTRRAFNKALSMIPFLGLGVTQPITPKQNTNASMSIMVNNKAFEIGDIVSISGSILCEEGQEFQVMGFTQDGIVIQKNKHLRESNIVKGIFFDMKHWIRLNKFS